MYKALWYVKSKHLSDLFISETRCVNYVPLICSKNKTELFVLLVYLLVYRVYLKSFCSYSTHIFSSVSLSSFSYMYNRSINDDTV